MDVNSEKLEMPFGGGKAKAEGRVAVGVLLIIALAYRLAWPLALLSALSGRHISLAELEAIGPLIGG